MKSAIKASRGRAGHATSFLLGNANVNPCMDIKEFCHVYALPQQTFTRITGFAPRSVSGWANGKPRNASTEKRLVETRRLFEALARLVKPAAIGGWLEKPNPAFAGSTPSQVIERGETDRLWRMIYELESGQPG